MEWKKLYKFANILLSHIKFGICCKFNFFLQFPLKFVDFKLGQSPSIICYKICLNWIFSSPECCICFPKAAMASGLYLHIYTQHAQYGRHGDYFNINLTVRSKQVKDLNVSFARSLHIHHDSPATVYGVSRFRAMASVAWENVFYNCAGVAQSSLNSIQDRVPWKHRPMLV